MEDLKGIFAKRLVELREDWRITQQDLANELGITRQSLSLYENAERTISIDLLVKIADFFNVTVDYLLGQTEAATTETTLREVCDYTRLSEKAVSQLTTFAARSVYQETLETAIKGEETRAQVEHREIDTRYILKSLSDINIEVDYQTVSQFLHNDNPILTPMDFINFMLEDKAFEEFMNEILTYHSDKLEKGIEDFDYYFIWKSQKYINGIIERFVKQTNDEL